MVQAFRPISASNYHPLATSHVISFIRRKDEFSLNRYAQFVPAPGPTFFYTEVERDQQIRVRNLALHVWARGAKREPRGDNKIAFREIQAFTVRYDFNYEEDTETLKRHQDQWKAKTVLIEMLGSQAMTARTVNVWKGIDATGTQTVADPVWKGLDNPSQWPSSNVADVNALNNGAGTWDKASANETDVSYMAIRKSLLEAANRIFLQTRGRVKWKDLRLIISPNLAKAMSNTAEIREYLKYAHWATKDVLEGPTNYNEQYGLPAKLYGIEVVVEDAMWLNTPATAGATAADANTTYIKNDDTAAIVSREGAIDTVSGPSFSTFQIWWEGHNLVFEEFDDPEHRLTRFHLSDSYTPVGTALVSGMLIQNVI